MAVSPPRSCPAARRFARQRARVAERDAPQLGPRARQPAAIGAPEERIWFYAAHPGAEKFTAADEKMQRLRVRGADDAPARAIQSGAADVPARNLAEPRAEPDRAALHEGLKSDLLGDRVSCAARRFRLRQARESASERPPRRAA